MNSKQALEEYWQSDNFKGSQQYIIDAVLDGKDVLALLPTGGGKSICYQIPGLIKEGICIVVSPLIALIQDQVDALKSKGIKALALTGGIRYEEVLDILDNCQYGNYKFLYLSPERLQQELVQERIEQMNVNLIAIDEAHCISQWGNDFRPAYLNCGILRELKPEIPIIALTATATSGVAKNIIDNLKLRECSIFKDSFERSNIIYQVLRAEDKQYKLKKLCQACSNSCIVYVRTRRLAEELAGILQKNGNSSSYFHGGITREEKEKKLKDWQNNRIQIMVATNAFGMGVDKPDVGLVVHYQIPESIENYFQEAGRAGRDGEKARAILLTNDADKIQVKNQFLSVLPDIPFIKLVYNKLNNFFQIPYGSGSNETFHFSFNEFSGAYQLNAILAYNALQVLDRHSVVSLTQSFHRKTEIQFVASKKELMRYMSKHVEFTDIIQLILRTYGGVFDYNTKINTLLLSKKANKSEDDIVAILERLQQDNIIEYSGRQGDLQITFLVPREDDRTINSISKEVKEQQRVKINNVASMLSYIQNNKRCRSRQLLEYFGEKNAANCGQCDVCIGDKSITDATLDSVEAKIFEILKRKEQSSRDIIKQMAIDETIILKVLQSMLEDGHIAINQKNKYTVN